MGFDKNIPEERLTLTKILVFSAFFLNANYGIQLTYGKHSPENREPIQRSNINSFEIIFGLLLNPPFFPLPFSLYEGIEFLIKILIDKYTKYRSLLYDSKYKQFHLDSNN